MRPRLFDENAVLTVAFDQFWRKGVRGTSLSDIARDVGMQRGSLYNAYGTKEALFLRAYARYADDYLAAVASALAVGKLRERLERFFDVAIRNFSIGTPPRGCPTTRGLMEVASIEGDELAEEVRTAFAGLLSRLTGFLWEAFAQGVASGEFSGSPDAAAEHVLTIARGLVVLESAYHDEPMLQRVAANTIDILLGAGHDI